MTLNDLGNIGELLGGVAVVISLLYLAVQIRHNSQISRFDAHRSLSQDMAAVLGNISADPDLYRIWKIMTNHPEQATDEDRERFGMLLYQVFTTFSDAERFGRMDKDLQTRFQAYMERFLGFEAVRSWWSRQGEHYSKEFRAHVENSMKKFLAEK
ncbi:MAG: hypothetical protein HKN35_09850 [Woeseia sp.]|nr:hypothetical protein [Woeseia sp.]MBT8096280.1 hypothetical protein [Woeseia sp.]NNE61187.1 hypothetical protein [Woeseia sp.]